MIRLSLIGLWLLLALGTANAQVDNRIPYLAPVDGAGTDASPFQSRCFGMPGFGNIDLRPNATTAAGFFLCLSNSLPANMTGVHQLGASLTAPINATAKSRILAALGRTVVGSTVDEAIKEIVIPRLRRPKSGTHEIYLGKPTPSIQVAATWENDLRYKGLAVALRERGEQLVEPVLHAFDAAVAWAASFTDTFTGANQATLAGDLTWTEYADSNWGRDTNTSIASSNTSTTAEGRAEHSTADDAQEVQADFTWTAAGTNSFRCGPKTREETSTNRTYYAFYVRVTNTNNDYIIIKRVAGTPTTLAASAGATSSPATIKGVSSASDSHSLYVGGVLTAGPVTDASITGNLRGGLSYLSAIVTTEECRADNFIIRDVSAGGGGMRRRAS